ncbi:hypothetical protein Tco_1073808 [Tanacetum coccineum]
MVVQAQEVQGEGSAIPTDPQHTPTITQPSSSQPQKKQRPRKPSRKNTEVPQPSGSPNIVADEAVNEEMDDSLVRATITASSIEAEQDSGGGPKRQQIMGDSSTQTRFKRVSKLSNDPLLLRGNTLRSGEDSLKLQELMELCTNLQQRVLDLEQTNTTQALEIDSLKRRVKKLKKKQRLRAYRLKRLYKFALSRRVESSDEEGLGEEDASKQGRISDIDADAGISLVSTHFYTDTDMFGVHDLVGDEVVIETKVASKDVNLSVDEVILSQALSALKTAKPKADKVVIQQPKIRTTTAATTVTAASTRPKAKGLVIHEEEQATTPIISSQQPSQVKVLDKGKGIMVEEPLKMKKKDQVSFDEQEAKRLQAEFDEEERLAREKDEANIALTEEWDDIQAKIDVNYQLAQRLQAKEQEELTDAEKARLFIQLLEKRRKHFVAKRVEEQRNKPPTKAQQKKTMITYLKNMEELSWWKRVPRKAEVVEESSKKAEVILMKIVPDEEEVAINSIPSATKPPRIMLKSFDKEDLETLWKMLKAKHGSTRPEEGYERVLWGDLKIMFEHHVEDTIQECKVQEVKASDASSGENDCNRIVSDNGIVQGLENQNNTSRDKSSRSMNECNDKSNSGDDTDINPSYDTTNVETGDSNVIPDSPDMCDNDIQNDQDAIQKQLKKPNASLTQELTECKSILAETSSTLGESNSVGDSCLVALQNKQTKFERYKNLNDDTIDYEKLEHKLNETLGILAQKDINIKEDLKLKAYKISVVKEKHDELVKQSLLTKSHYEGLVKDKTKVITDLKLKEEKDINKIISLEKQLKFLNEIIYKRNQSIQTIHMLAPKYPTFNGRPTFANPMYLKKAQYEKPCLYEIPHNQSDPANSLVPDREETLTLERESRSKLNKDLVKPYDYTKLNSLYEIFKPPTQEYLLQLAHQMKELVDQAWVKHSEDHLHLRAPTTHDMEILIKTCLIPLALKTRNDSFAFVHELKQEMHADLKYVESLEKEVDELESDKAEFSNMYDMLLQECVSNDVMCSYLHSLSDLDAHAELQCLYVHKVKECECLAQKLSKQTEFVSKEVYNELLRSFAKLEKHSISLELALQQYLKGQLKDKNIAISELNKLIEKMKGKSVDTNFEKQSIFGKPPLQPIRNQPVPQVRKSSLPKPYDVNAPSPSRNSLKHVSFQSPREFVSSNDLVHNYYLEEAKKMAQLQKDKALNTKPSVQQSTRF